MRLSAKSTTLLLALLLGACAGSQERDFKENVAEANFKLGIGYMQSGHYEVAAEKLLKSLQFDENSPEAHNAIAILYEEMREYGPAETHFKRAIDAAPTEPSYLVNYGLLLAQQGDSLRAAEFLERATALDPNWSRSHAQLGELAKLMDGGTINSNAAKTVYAEMAAGGGSPKAIVAKLGLDQSVDAGELEAIIAGVLAGMPDKVAEFRGGKTSLLGMFTGQVMRATGNKADPKQVQQILKRQLEA